MEERKTPKQTVGAGKKTRRRDFFTPGEGKNINSKHFKLKNNVYYTHPGGNKTDGVGLNTKRRTDPLYPEKDPTGKKMIVEE